MIPPPLRLLIKLLAFLLPLALPGQVQKFRHITVDDGLPFNTVGSIAQDSTGFMWLGTPDGLARFDGYSLKIFRHIPEDSSSVISNAIRTLLVDKQNKLWVGTRYGLCVRDPLTEKFHWFPTDSSGKKGLLAENISCLMEKNGKIWVGSLGGGIHIIDAVTYEITCLRNKKEDPSSLPSDYVRGIDEDSKGNVWVAMYADGVCMLTKDGKLVKRLGMKDGLPVNEVRNLFVDSKDQIWISCWASGTCVFDQAKGKMHYNRDPDSWLYKIENGLITMFMEDREGKIWFATAEHGPGYYDPKNGKLFYYESDPEDPQSVSDKTVFSLLEDKSGIIWAGTWHGGVNIFDPKAHQILHFKSDKQKSNSLNSNIVWRFLKDSNGKLLIGTSSSLNEFDPNTYEFKKVHTVAAHADGPSEKTIVQSLYRQSNGHLWIGSNGAGMYRHIPGKSGFTVYPPISVPGSFPYHTAYCMTEDLDHNLWFATIGGGLAKYLPEKDAFDVIVNDPADSTSISSDVILFILRRNDGRFWLATPNGLDLFHPITRSTKHFRSVAKDSTTLLNDGINTFQYGKGGILWIGTSAGLCSYDEEQNSFTRYDKDPGGVMDNEIMGLSEDGLGYLWISTSRGLYRMNIAKRSYRLLEPADGIQSRQFLLNAVYRDSSGLLYLGGVNGFNIIDPKKVQINSSQPKVVFTRLTVLNEDVQLPGSITYLPEITISYSDYFFSLEFAALEYSDPIRNRYQYFLEGFSKEWVDLGHTRFVTFTNLSPGEYTLKVKACNNHGIWNEDPASIRINIPPPFYMTKWFYALCLITLVSGIWLFIKWREKKLKEEKLHLENVVEQRTHELREEKEKVDAAHKDIKDSINYAKRIQEAMLPLASEIRTALPDSFVLFKPRDVVSGDFYWYHQRGKETFLAAADCTGHGVPGALMSMIGSSILTQLITDERNSDPGKILELLNAELRQALKQHLSDSETRDGMDIALIRINISTGDLAYAGANRPLYIIRKTIPEIEEIKADKYSIGGIDADIKIFNTHTDKLEKGDTVYIFSDGYPDQFGGDTGKKFMTKNFKRLLMLFNNAALADVKNKLEGEFESWRGMYEQVDDVLVIGIRRNM